MRNILNRLLGATEPDKVGEEVEFWRGEVANYLAWYNGELDPHFGTPRPEEGQKLRHRCAVHSAILTWFELHQKVKYAADLQLPVSAFEGQRLLDVGSGPMPSAEAFSASELYCLDPLLPAYLEAGFPLHIYRAGTRMVHAYAEDMPFEDDYFDAVISVNAIDHVDDLRETSREIRRVLRPGGMLHLHAHYHDATPAEPIELNDEVMRDVFGWCSGLSKIHESTEKHGWTVPEGESYALWSNR